MRLIGAASVVFVIALICATWQFAPATQADQERGVSEENGGPASRDGQAIFRFDTFGDEQLWTQVLRMHDVIATVSPATALAVGLKVDVEALPEEVIAALRAGQIDLTNPAVTVELLRVNAVVGVKGDVDQGGQLTQVGVTCALCHSSVDNSFAPGNRQTARRLGKHGSQRRCDRGPLAGTGRGNESGVQDVGARHVRSAPPLLRRYEHRSAE